LNASAFVVGPPEKAGAALLDLARSVGFARVERYQGLGRVERQSADTPLVFFLCAAVADVLTLKPMADAIRYSPSHKLRFSPLIYFAHSPSIDSIKSCIGMGFDDVIALPYSGGSMSDRLGRQVGKPHTYYETSTYFGPDRRNRVGESRSSGSDHGGGEFRRIEIIRNPVTGIDVLRDDFEVVV
jgi:hypothetical protein